MNGSSTSFLLVLPLAALMLVGGAEEPSRSVHLIAARQPTVELVCPPEVRLGDTVAITLRVRHDGSQPLALQLPGRPVAFDVVIMGANGIEVWRRLHGTVTASALMLVQLAPGEFRDFTAEWAQVDNAGRPVGPGTYLVRGILPLEGRRLTTAAGELLIAR